MMTARARPLTRLGLVADVGGTNVRFALADLTTLALSRFERYAGADFPSLTAAAKAYLRAVRARPEAACLAVAGPVAGDTVQFTNSPWSFSQNELRAALGLSTLLTVNDFAALAHALPHLAPSELHRIGGGAPAAHGAKVVLGPGTGLGMAGLVWSATGWVAVESEGGHAAFAVEDAEEFAMLQRLLHGRERLSVERVLSGPGLADAYRVLAELRGKTPEALDAPEVVKRAGERSDPIAEAALGRFVVWLGRFAGDAALAFGARGGVYIGGGIAPRLLDALTTGAFRQAFEAKGRMAGYLAPIPVSVILAPDAGLTGAAAALSAAGEQ